LKSDKNLHGHCTQQLQVCTELQAHIFTSDLSPYSYSSGNRTPGSFWIPWQTSFASTSSYLSVLQSARLLV